MPNSKKKPLEIVETDKIEVVKNENPRREGSKAHDRAAAVLAAKGKTVRTALTRGARVSTIRHLVEEGLVKVVRAAKTPAKRAA